jgi:hypothetical protein
MFLKLSVILPILTEVTSTIRYLGFIRKMHSSFGTNILPEILKASFDNKITLLKFWFTWQTLIYIFRLEVLLVVAKHIDNVLAVGP